MPTSRLYVPQSPSPDSPSYWEISAADLTGFHLSPTELLTGGCPSSVSVLPAGDAANPTTEASAVDPNSDLIWVARSQFNDDGEHQWTTHSLAWANPDSPWLFSVSADSEAGRRQLVDAFVTAAGG